MADHNCTTHHLACDCREAKFAAIEAERDAMKARLAEIREAFEAYRDTKGCGCCSSHDHWQHGCRMNALLEEPSEKEDHRG